MTNSNISPDYFWDEMTMAEANAIIDAVSNNEKAEWEKVRWSAYITALTQGAKLNKPQDLVTFSWETTEGESSAKDKRTQEEIREQLQKMVKFIQDDSTELQSIHSGERIIIKTLKQEN